MKTICLCAFLALLSFPWLVSGSHSTQFSREKWRQDYQSLKEYLRTGYANLEWMKQARKMAREFQSGVDDLVRQAELDEAKKAVEDARSNLNKEIEKAVDPTGEVKQALSDSGIRTPTPSIPVSPPKPAASGNGSAASTVEAPAAPAPADAGTATPTPPVATKSA